MAVSDPNIVGHLGKGGPEEPPRRAEDDRALGVRNVVRGLRHLKPEVRWRNSREATRLTERGLLC